MNAPFVSFVQLQQLRGVGSAHTCHYAPDTLTGANETNTTAESHFMEPNRRTLSWLSNANEGVIKTTEIVFSEKKEMAYHANSVRYIRSFAYWQTVSLLVAQTKAKAKGFKMARLCAGVLRTTLIKSHAR
jgi:hypothetical protein